MIQQSTYSKALSWFTQIGALMVALVGAAVLIGWLRDFVLVKSFLPGLPNMKVNTAVAFLVAGIALWSLQTSRPKSPFFAHVLACFVVALGSLTLAEDLFGIDLGIDQLIARDVAEAASTLYPGRMATVTALSFVFIGLGLLELKARKLRFPGRADWLALPPLFFGSVSIVGYAYEVRPLYIIGPNGSMAAHAALSFLILSVSLLAADPTRGIARIFISDTDGGIMARRLLPTIPLILFGIGWLRMAGEDARLYDTHFGLALMVVAGIAVSVIVVASTAAKLHNVDIKRAQAEDEIIAINAGLELRVKERTKELENSLAQVKQLSGMLPICSWCKKVRDDADYWQSVEQFVADRTDAIFSHGICPDCFTKVMSNETNAKEADTLQTEP